MRSAFWTELRRSPLRWWLPVLAALHVVVLAGDNGSWVGDWPRASAAALRPVVFLGPLFAAGAAWAAARSGLPGVADRMRGSARAGWVLDAAQLVSSAAVGLGGYLVGVAYVALASISRAGPGFVWPGYLLLGAAVTIACAAIGHGVGRATGSLFGAPVVAGAGCLVLMMAFSSLLGLTSQGNVVLGDPAYSVTPDAIATRALLALGLAAAAVTVPSLVGRGPGRWRPTLQSWSGGAVGLTAVAAATLLLPTHNVLEVRASPADPVCSATVPKVCLWPEDRKYLDDVTALALRAERLPPLFRVPRAFYEQGLQPHTALNDANDFSLDNGSVSNGLMWFVAITMEGDVWTSTFGARACFPASMSQNSYNTLEHAAFLLTQWLTTRIFGGVQPPTVFGGPPGVDPVAVGHLAKEPEATQVAFAAAQARVQDQYACRAHA